MQNWELMAKVMQNQAEREKQGNIHESWKRWQEPNRIRSRERQRRLRAAKKANSAKDTPTIDCLDVHKESAGA